MPTTQTPSPEEVGILALVKDYWLPIATTLGGGILGALTTMVNLRTSQSEAVTKQLQTLMQGYQEQMKLMQSGYEGRIKDLVDRQIRLELVVEELRKQLDKRPLCENCVTRVKLEGEIKNIQEDLDHERTRAMATHVQHMDRPTHELSETEM